MKHLIHNHQRPSFVFWEIFKNQNRHKNWYIFKELFMNDSGRKCHRLFTLYSNFSSFVLSNVTFYIHYRSLTSEKKFIGSIFSFETILKSHRLPNCDGWRYPIWFILISYISTLVKHIDIILRFQEQTSPNKFYFCHGG